LAPVDHSPGLVTDHAVRGKTIGLLPFLRLSYRARTPVAISLGADSLLGTLDRLALRVQLDQRGLAGDRLIGVATSTAATDHDISGLDTAEHLGPLLGGRGAPLAG